MAIGDVIIRIVRSDGEEYILGDEKWRIPNDGLENFDNLDYSVTSDEIPSYDGAIVTSKRVKKQDRTIKAECATPSMNEKLRAEVISFFNPKYSFEVFVKYMGRTRMYSGEQIGFLCTTGNIYQKAQLTWTVLSPNPYFQSDGLYNKDLAWNEPRFGFPWVSFLPPEEGQPRIANTGFITSVHVFNKEADLYNDGDVPSGMRVEVTCLGDVINPFIRIGNGFFRFKNRKFNAGDRIVLDAISKPPKVEINGVNAMNRLDKTSNILDMVLDVGFSRISYDAEEGDLNMSVVVFWRKNYLGI